MARVKIVSQALKASMQKCIVYVCMYVSYVLEHTWPGWKLSVSADHALFLRLHLRNTEY